MLIAAPKLRQVMFLLSLLRLEPPPLELSGSIGRVGDGDGGGGPSFGRL